MSTPHTWFGKVIAGVLNIFKSSAVKIWDSLTPEEQESLKHGSGVVAIINAHLTDVPQVIKDEIQAQFPDLDINTLEAELINICGYLGITLNQQTIDDAIIALQNYLSTKTGTIWEWASSAVAELITVALTPNLTVFAKVSMLIEYVYRTYIQKP